MNLLPNTLPYEIKLKIYKYTDLQTCLNLDITDKYVLNYLYKKANIKCYRDVIKYDCLKSILTYIKSNKNLELKYTDFDYSNDKIDRIYKFNQSLIKFLNVDETQLHKFEISKLNSMIDFDYFLNLSNQW